MHRSLHCASNNKTLLCEYFLAPNASKRVGVYVFDILTTGFLVLLNILSVIYRFLL